jgi:hypothetical protein
MEPHPMAGDMDPEREILETAARMSIFVEEKKSAIFANDKEGIYVSEKAVDSSAPTSEGDESSLYVYERDNMVRDETGRIVVETSELAITALHVDDDPSLSPWTFRTFFLGIYVNTSML